MVELSAERDSLDDFVRDLVVELRGLGGRFEKAMEAADIRELSVLGVSMTRGDHEASRKSLDVLVRRAIESASPNKLVLVIDETTVLATALERRNAGTGMAFLHGLRRLRQENQGKLAMVLLGSIGFHHVTNDALSTVNDLVTVPVREIQRPDAIYLAQCLLMGEGVPVGDVRIAEAMAATAEQIPYYIHHLVASAGIRSRQLGIALTAADVPDLLEAALTDPDDPWNLRHYRDRLPGYYGTDSDLVTEVLDAYASAGTVPLSVDDVMAQLATFPQSPTRSGLVRLVERLEADHYLRRIADADTFASSLMRRAWLAFRR